ncbi:MAG TPA: hypothetical protein VFB66_02855, partial [Tepidisphaeraceae bacterium]|nr:hypothetical protein [Tepidisphaeraceae bacterium]
PGLLRVLASFTDPKALEGATAGSANALVRAGGDIGKLMAVVKVINSDGSAAEGAEADAYSGKYALEQRLSAGKEGLALNGTMNVTDFAVADVDASPNTGRRAGGQTAAPAAPTGGGISERSIKLANDVTLDQARRALAIRNVALSMETTKALELQLSGNVQDFSGQRKLENVKGTLGYDWAKLWEIAKPMLSPETRKDLDLRIAGQSKRNFTLGGSFPAAAPDGRPLAFNESVRSLDGSFEGGFDVVEVNGMTIEKLELPLTLRDGVVTVAYAAKTDGQNRPPAAKLNGGELNLGGATIDLTGDTPRLSIPADTKLLAGSSLNPVFADKFGQFINNPAFVGAMDARGLIDLNIRRCDRLPLSGLVLKSDRSEAGIELDFTIREMYLGGSKLFWALEKTGYVSFAKSSQWYIPEGHISIARGKSKQNIVINVGETERPFRIEGITDLSTQRLELTVTIPPRLLRQISRDAEKIFPKGLPIPVGGTLTAPAPDMQRVIPTLVQQGLVGGLLNQAKEQLENRREDRPDDSAPAKPDDRAANDEKMEPEQPARDPDPVKDIFDLVEKGIRDRGESDREKRERREQRQKEREKQKQQQGQQPAAGAGEGVSGSESIGRQSPRRRDRD